MSYFTKLFLGPTETLDFVVSKRMKKRSQTSSISGKQVSTRAFAGEAVHEKYLKHFNPFTESDRDQSDTCIARRYEFCQPLECNLKGSKLRQIQAYGEITPMNYRLDQKNPTHIYIYIYL